MALIQCNFYANSLMRTATIHVIIPSDKRTALGQPAAPARFPVLYLLHGILGNYTDWVCGTTIQSLADQYDLCVVMPSGDNRFYCDSSRGDNYGTFISEELPDFIRRTFPVSSKREETFLAGLSMGGFGTIVNGLKKPETFGCLGLFSAALVKDNIVHAGEKGRMDLLTAAQYRTIFDLDNVKDYDGSCNDYEFLAKNCPKEKPVIWMACGMEDSLIDANRAYAKLLEKNGFDVTWQEWHGKHDWVFWQECIERFVPWLPIQKGEAGVSSGNVIVEKK